MAPLPWFCGLMCFYCMYYNFNEVSRELRERYLCLKLTETPLILFGNIYFILAEELPDWKIFLDLNHKANFDLGSNNKFERK